MHRGKKVAVVIPAHNEEPRIRATLAAVPPLVDRIYVVDDASPDRQVDVIEAMAKEDRRIVLLRHTTNQGPGGAIITGYLHAHQSGEDLVVVVGGDNQMDLTAVTDFLDPLIEGKADYAKGNRFLLGDIGDSYERMPRLRFVANWLITGITKISSGYFKIFDVVNGYTAITARALARVDWRKAWPEYGYPMDFLIRLNAYGLRVVDIPHRAIYTAGERQTQIKGMRYAIRVSPMLIRGFFWRLYFKYLYRDFHPLVFFYYGSFVLLPSGLTFGLVLIASWLSHGAMVTGPRAIFVALLLLSGIQLFLFAMLFDMQESA